MKQTVLTLLLQALQQLHDQGVIQEIPNQLSIDRTKDTKFGDFASNAALILAKQAGQKPRDLATRIVAALPDNAVLTKTEIAGPGFINFYLNESAQRSVVSQVLHDGERYGTSSIGQQQRIQVEFVSANPTGPLHVGHGRGAAYGAVVANLLAAVGYQVEREYYVNDAGRQMDILATSVWLRYLDLCGHQFTFPSNAYQGDYIWDIGAELHRTRGEVFSHTPAQVFAGVVDDEPAGGDKEKHIDGLIQNAKKLLGETLYREVFDLSLARILCNIRKDLEEFGITYQNWFSERSLTESGALNRAIERLESQGQIYTQNGAKWFRSSALGDEKDRVVVRDNGQTTYFASDIAYHMNKFERGFSHVIDVWGADHHGYVPRVKAALQAMGEDPSRLQILLVQFAVLYEKGEKVQMSTRSGEFVTLRELRQAVGNDAARYFYAMRKCEQHLDFDMDLARSRSKENPVYYVQYAHARICKVFQQLTQQGHQHTIEAGLQALDLLSEPLEKQLMTTLSRYAEIVESAALAHEPHQITHYLQDLANDLHSYYDSDNKRIRILVEDEKLRNARLCLVSATRQVLRNGLALLDVSAPEQM